MADISDVLASIRDAAAKILYPSGPGPGAAPPSVVSSPVRVYVGWPDSGLDKDLQQGICHVTIWPRGASREVPVRMDGWKSAKPPPPSMTATVGEEQITFTGDASVPYQIAAILVGRDTAYTHVLPPGATPESVAAAMAASIKVDTPTASAAGASVLIPGAMVLSARVVAGGLERKEIRRREEGIQVTAWCPTPQLRDAIIRLLDEAFQEELESIPLPDGTSAFLKYGGSPFDEDARAQPLHRRDLMLTAEFALTRTRVVPGIAVTTLNVTHDPSLITRVIIV